ncbi:MAG: glycogen debranching protein GlgX [Rhodospirillaceae bacterium]|nr:glycogen debranching protein GlgX [Rhodospirillaceae bacterium]
MKRPAKTAANTMPFATQPGSAHPLGATVAKDGVNFSVFSQYATGVELLLFDGPDAAAPSQVIALSAEANRTFHFWHVFVVGATPGLHYAYRVDGPWQPENGHRFDSTKVLIDPYAFANSTALWKRGDACGHGDNVATSMRSVVVDPYAYDWAGDQPLKRPINETIIYEMHVGGFTRSPSSGVAAPGSFRGVIEKIPYLQDLGVTAVELLPVFQFDDSEARIVDGRRLTNYWGYSTMAYFAPHPGYCERAAMGAHLDEFRDMVKALHAAGIEVILDVVFNHTDEGNHMGPVFTFKGFDNSVYYYLVQNDKQYYYDYTGCGNTFNCNHPIGSKLIVDCLKFWVEDMHVDGFRFDEGSVLSRGPDGAPMEYPPVLWNIELDEALADTKVVAEAWDAAGLYQIGHFPGFRWGEWNGRYRDDLRRFVKGDPGLTGAVASRISGSADLYQWSGHQPVNSVNFITAHDGFTLNDLVSYDGKHNDANGEGNRDGIDDNLSWNCGWEGATDDAGIERLRAQQIRNFAALLLVSQGVPMMVMGDEVRRTQAGNNNTYCQDNPMGWFDWELVEKNADLLRFWKHMIAFRRSHPAVHRSRYFTGRVNERGLADIAWHGTELGQPNWDDGAARVIGFTLGGFAGEADIHVMANMYWEPLAMAVPDANGRQWVRAVDTARDAPDDIRPEGSEEPHSGSHYTVGGRSVVVLISK